MRALLLLCFLLCVAATPHAQPGALDLDFATDGQYFSAGEGRGTAYASLPQRDGTLLLGGELGGVAVVVRFAADGSLDPSFGVDGVLSVPRFGENGASVQELIADGQGGAYVVGLNAAAGYVLRLLPSGAFDQEFGGDLEGTVFLPSGLESTTLSGASIPGGGLVVSGINRTEADGRNVFVARFDEAGLPVAAFGEEGVALIPDIIDNSSVVPFPVAAYPDGRVVVAGYQAPSAVVFRLEADGDLDPTFGVDGVRVLGEVGIPSVSGALTLDDEGRVVAGGFVVVDGGARAEAFVARLSETGDLDPSFNGGFVIGAFGSLAVAFDLFVQQDGDIVLVGSGGNETVREGFLAARYTDAGELDTSFGDGGSVVYGLGSNATCYAGSMRATGEIVMVGFRAGESGAREFAAIQLQNDGLPISAAVAEGPTSAESALGLPYPNPTTGAFTLPLRTAGGAVQVDVIDMLGRQVARLHDGPVTDLALQADLEGAPSGLYIVRVTDGRQVWTQRLVKR